MNGAATKKVDGFGWRIALLLGCACALWFGWVGYIASDDGLYYAQALRWLQEGPHGGGNHWGTRFPLILSFAGAIAMFGQNFGAFEATALFWYVGLVAVAGLHAGAALGERAGWITAILVGTMPLVAGSASIVNCDAPEAVFLIGGAWLLGTARRDGAALLAGASFALAALSRETALLAIAGLTLPFITGRPVARRLYLVAAAGFLAMMVGEALFQWIVSGDPLHRYALAAHHDAGIDRAANREGNLLVHPLVDPLLVLLVNNEFGALFWLAVPAAVLAFNGRRRPPKTVVLLGALALGNVVAVGLLGDLLVLNPRYFTLAAIFAATLLGGWLAGLRPLGRMLTLAAMMLINIALLGFANAHPQWPAEALARAAREHPDALILADRATADRAALWLAFDGSRNVTTDPRARAAFELTPSGRGRTAIAVYLPPPTRMGLALRAARLSRLLPGALARRAMEPGPTVFLVEHDRRH